MAEETGQFIVGGPEQEVAVGMLKDQILVAVINKLGGEVFVPLDSLQYTGVDMIMMRAGEDPETHAKGLIVRLLQKA